MRKIDDIKWGAKELLPKLSALIDAIDELRGEAEEEMDSLRLEADENRFSGVSEHYAEMDEAANMLEAAFECIDECYSELRNVANIGRR